MNYVFTGILFSCVPSIQSGGVTASAMGKAPYGLGITLGSGHSGFFPPIAAIPQVCRACF